MGVIGLIDGMVWFHRELVEIIIARDQIVLGGMQHVC